MAQGVYPNITCTKPLNSSSCPQHEVRLSGFRTQKPVASKITDSLLKQRIITLYGEINQEAAERVTQCLLVMDHESNDPIRLIINSQGGHVESGDTIFDMIRFVKSKVYVVERVGLPALGH